LKSALIEKMNVMGIYVLMTKMLLIKYGRY